MTNKNNLRELISPDDDYLGVGENKLMQPDAISPHPLIYAGELIDRLTHTQEGFLVAKMYGMSDAAAARSVNVKPGTAYHWKLNKDFKHLYTLVTEQPVVMAAEVAAFGLTKAINQIVKMLEHPSVDVQQYAIDKLIKIGGLDKKRVEVTNKNVSDDDIDRHLDAIERRRIDRAGEGTGDSEV